MVGVGMIGIVVLLEFGDARAGFGQAHAAEDADLGHAPEKVVVIFGAQSSDGLEGV